MFNSQLKVFCVVITLLHYKNFADTQYQLCVHIAFLNKVLFNGGKVKKAESEGVENRDETREIRKKSGMGH
jgi:hypothetical protein